MNNIASGDCVAASTPAAVSSLPRAPVPTRGVTLSRFVLANGPEAKVRAALRERPHHVERMAGFVRMEVLCPLDRPQESWLVIPWRSGDDYRAWYRGHGDRGSHRGILNGLQRVGRETRIRRTRSRLRMR